MDLEEEDLVLQAAVGGNLVDHVEGTCLYMGYLPLHLHFFNMFVRKENVEPKKDQNFLKRISSTLEVKFWRERAAFQRSAFGRSTAGNDVVATIFIRIFFFFSVFLCRDLFS